MYNTAISNCRGNIMKPFIEVNNLSFKYNEDSEDVLKNIDMEIFQGEWVSICGHNGSGKSTLAKFFNGLLTPLTANTVRVAGHDTSDEESIWAVRKLVGMVFQNPDNQMVATTVRDDVAFGLENIGVAHHEMQARIDEAISKVKMKQYLDHEPHRLSGGQKQRVAIAGIIAMNPSVIILDEATSMLDPQGREEVINTVWQLKQSEGMTVINITHDLEETVRSDKVFVLNKGVITAYGTPTEVFGHVEKLEDAGLNLPFSFKVQKQLEKKGYPIEKVCLTKDELVEELWKLK